MKKPFAIIVQFGARPNLNKGAFHRFRAVWIGLFCLAICCCALTTEAFSSADADAIFAAHTKAFYQVTNGGAFYVKSTIGGQRADFWTEAEQLEMVMDAYERTTNTEPLVMFTNLFHGFLAEHGPIWEVPLG
jgi:hypothetical protein